MSTDATHSTTIVRRWRTMGWTAPVLLLMILIPLVAACGGGSSSPGVASIDATPTATADDATASDGSEPTESDEPSDASEPTEPGEQSELAYSQCMRDNGITNFPDPGANGEIALDGNAVDMDSPQFKAADETCKQLLPDGGEGGTTNESGGGN